MADQQSWNDALPDERDRLLRPLMYVDWLIRVQTAAAGAAAWESFSPTRLELQQSALALVERMIASVDGE